MSRTRARTFDIGIFDLQIGSMGGMAVTMALRLDESSGRLPHVPVLMLLDRVADVHLARAAAPTAGWSSRSTRCACAGRAHGARRRARTTRASPATCRSPPMAPGRGRRPRCLADPPSAGRTQSSRTRHQRVGSPPATGCSAAWLARHVRDVEAGGSNPLTPTKWPLTRSFSAPTTAADVEDHPENAEGDQQCDLMATTRGDCEQFIALPASPFRRLRR